MNVATKCLKCGARMLLDASQVFRSGSRFPCERPGCDFAWVTARDGCKVELVPASPPVTVTVDRSYDPLRPEDVDLLGCHPYRPGCECVRCDHVRGDAEPDLASVEDEGDDP